MLELTELKKMLKDEKISYIDTKLYGTGDAVEIRELEAFVYYGIITVANKKNDDVRIYDNYAEAIEYIKKEGK